MSVTSTPTRSCRCSGGWSSGQRSRPTSRRRWSLPPPVPTVGRRRARCSSAASTRAGARCSRATRAARARTSPPTRTGSCCSAGCRCCARCTCADRCTRPTRGERGLLRNAPSREPAGRLGIAPVPRAHRPGRAGGALRGSQPVRFEGEDVPCPEHWGGYRLAPAEIELWQGRANRMHDRLRYQRDDAAVRRLEDRAASVRRPGRPHGGDETGDEVLPVGHRLGVGEVAPHGNGS